MWSVYAIFAFLSASCPHLRLVVALLHFGRRDGKTLAPLRSPRWKNLGSTSVAGMEKPWLHFGRRDYAFDSDAGNLLETNTNLS